MIYLRIYLSIFLYLSIYLYIYIEIILYNFEKNIIYIYIIIIIYIYTYSINKYVYVYLVVLASASADASVDPCKIEYLAIPGSWSPRFCFGQASLRPATSRFFKQAGTPARVCKPALVCQSFANRCWLLFAGLTCKGIAASLKMGGNG